MCQMELWLQVACAKAEGSTNSAYVKLRGKGLEGVRGFIAETVDSLLTWLRCRIAP